jgi:hypothetical protein
MRSLMWRGLPGAPAIAAVLRSHVLLTRQARQRAVSACLVIYIYRLASRQEDAWC